MKKAIIIISIFLHSFVSNGQVTNNIIKKNGLALCNGSVYTGQYKHYDNDSTLLIENYKNGYLHGDSAIVKYYPNGILKSVSSFSNGKLLKYKKNDYYGLSASIGDKTGGIVDRSWLSTQNQLKITLKTLSEKEINEEPLNKIIDNKNYNYSNFRIIGYLFSASPCSNCPDLERTSISDSIPIEIKNIINEKRRKAFYFQFIKCVSNNDTIILPSLKFEINK